MEDDAKRLMLNLLRAWAATADPDAPVAFGGRPYTARDYVAAVERDTPLGSAYCAFMEAAAKQAKRPLEEFLKDTIRPRALEPQAPQKPQKMERIEKLKKVVASS